MLKMKYNIIEWYRGQVIPPNYLIHVATQIKNDRYTLIEQSAHLVLLNISIY